MQLKKFYAFDKFIQPMVAEVLISNEVYRILKRVRRNIEILIERYEDAEEVKIEEKEKNIFR